MEIQLYCPNKSVFHLKLMKAFSCSLNVKLLRERSCIVWELTLINVNPHQIISHLFICPWATFRLICWNFGVFYHPITQKMTVCLQRKTRPQSSVGLHLVVLIGHHPYGVQRSKYKILNCSSISELLSACSNTFQCSTRLLLDSQGSGDMVYHHLQM